MSSVLLFDNHQSLAWSRVQQARGCSALQVKGVRWDMDLGGQTFEKRLLEHVADEFNAKSGLGKDVRSSAKAMAKLKKEVKRTKEILSANTEAPLNVESLFEDVDFRSDHPTLLDIP